MSKNPDSSSSRPRNLTALLAAAKRHADAGDARESHRLYRLILSQDPANPHAARALGAALLDAHRPTEAHEIIAPAARKLPFDPRLRALMGLCLLGTGQTPVAFHLFETMVRADPGSIPAKVGLARCLCANRRAHDALHLLTPLLPQHAGDPDLRSALGQASYMLVLGEDAVSHFQAAAVDRPAPGLLADLGWAFYMVRRTDEALAAFDRALAAEPDLARAIAGRARILTDRHADDEARTLIQSALDRGSLDARLLTAHARLARTPEEKAQSALLLERRIGLPQPASLRAPLLVSLGKLKEDSGDYDAAFDCFRRANESTPPFPIESHLKAIADIKGTFSRETPHHLPRNPESDPTPIFIVGMPRSGTSLIEQILGSHPAIHAGDELPYLQQIAATLPQRMKSTLPYPHCITSLTESDARDTGRLYLSRLRELSLIAERITDKMPWNFTLLGLIDLCLPGSRIIHCQRSPLDTCLSIYTTSLGQAHDYRRHLPDLAATYRAYHDLMAHWRTVLRTPMLEVRYEDLIANPESVSRKLIDFAGVPWDDRCLRFYESSRRTTTASTDQVRRPIYHSSINRWKHYEKHLGELIEGLRGLE